MINIKEFIPNWTTLFENVDFENYPKIPRSKLCVPAIYSWRVLRDNREFEIYIGEIEDVGRRFYHYLKPGPSQKTNIRLNKHLPMRREQGYKTNFELLTFDGMVVSDQIIITNTDLANKANRLFIENLIIIYYQKQNQTKLLNKTITNNK